MKKIPQDIIGDIAVLKFRRFTPWIMRKFKARRFLKSNPSIKTVLEKVGKFDGDLRIQKTHWLSGLKTSLANYKENDCSFKFDINETYFSPRLSNERKVLALDIVSLVKKDTKILVMFAGVAPFPIVIAKTLRKNGKKAIIYANELNGKANEYALENIHANKVEDYIRLLPGDANKIKIKEKFDIILMPRPNIKDTFLISALRLSKKGSIIFYHGFGKEEEVLEEIKRDTKDAIGKITLRKAGDIGPHAYRWLATFKVK